MIKKSLGAKAFRKGALGAVHSTSHALGFACHIHHGTAIARMAVPVTQYNETLLKSPTQNQPELQEQTNRSIQKMQNLHSLFEKEGFVGENRNALSSSIQKFLNSVNLVSGIRDLVETQDNKKEFLQNLSLIASQDSCQTNLVKLNLEDYKSIFNHASTL